MRRRGKAQPRLNCPRTQTLSRRRVSGHNRQKQEGWAAVEQQGQEEEEEGEGERAAEKAEAGATWRRKVTGKTRTVEV